MVIRLKTHDPFDGSRSPQPGLGRPSLRESRNVMEDIIRAAEACLESKSPQEISIREIATLAGTRPAMVYYYFGSKDGLLVEIVRRGLIEIQRRFLSTQESIRKNGFGNPIRLLVAEFANVYNQRPVLCRILISEVFREDSQVRNYLLEQRSVHGKAVLVDVVTQLSASGYYRKDIDIEGICMMIQSVVFFPLIVMKPYFASKNDGSKHYLDDKWIDLVSAVFDSYLQPRE